MKNLIIFFFLAGSFLAGYGQKPADRPYNENQDVHADIKKAVAQAKAENKHVLIQWGGNWCPWCIRFHNLAGSYVPIDSLLKKDYVYILANVPKEKEKRDFDLYREYGYPNRFGFPVFVVLDGSGKELHIQDSGLLEYGKAPGYDTANVINFLKMWNVRAVDPATYKKK